MQERLIRISLKQHKDGDFFMAVSDDLRGLVVHGHTVEEINERVPGAIRDLLEFDGVQVKSVTPVSEQSDGFVQVGRTSYRADTCMEAAE